MGKHRGANHSEGQVGHDQLGFNLGLSMGEGLEEPLCSVRQ